MRSMCGLDFMVTSFRRDESIFRANESSSETIVTRCTYYKDMSVVYVQLDTHTHGKMEESLQVGKYSFERLPKDS